MKYSINVKVGKIEYSTPGINTEHFNSEPQNFVMDGAEFGISSEATTEEYTAVIDMVKEIAVNVFSMLNQQDNLKVESVEVETKTEDEEAPAAEAQPFMPFSASL